MGDKMRREVDINIPHRHHLTGVPEATFYLHIGQRSIPGQINLALDEGLDQGIVVRIKHPVELDAISTKMRFESSEYTDVGWRCRPPSLSITASYCCSILQIVHTTGASTHRWLRGGP